MSWRELCSILSEESLIISGKGTNEVVKDHRGKQKPSILPTVPDSACRQNYTYEVLLDEEQASDSYADGTNVERIDDHGMLAEMAFDET